MKILLFLICFICSAYDLFAELSSNVTYRIDGDVVIERVPSVKASRNYCVPASVTMVLRYFDARIKQREIAKIFSSSHSSGTDTSSLPAFFGKGELENFGCRTVYTISTQEMSQLVSMYGNFSELSQRERRDFRKNMEKVGVFDAMDPAIVKKIFPQARQELITKFPEILCRYITAGYPLLWSVAMNFDPDERTEGGHMRVIVGYKAEKGSITEIIFLDPWSRKRVFKRVSFAEAVMMTVNLMVISPSR